MICLLYESPSFLAVHGDGDRLVEVLDGIAWWNGKPRLSDIPGIDPSDASPKRVQVTHIAEAVSTTLRSQAGLISLLCAIDSCRTFYVSGSSYLWKDLLSL